MTHLSIYKKKYPTFMDVLNFQPVRITSGEYNATKLVVGAQHIIRVTKKLVLVEAACVRMAGLELTVIQVCVYLF